MISDMRTYAPYLYLARFGSRVYPFSNQIPAERKTTRAMENYVIKDAVEVHDTAAKCTYLIPSKMLKTVDNVTFFEVNPGRCGGVAKMLLSKCNDDIKKAGSDRAFWVRRGDGNKKVLQCLKKLRTAAYKRKFGVTEGRLMSRAARHRVQQLTTNVIGVGFPGIDDIPARELAMLFEYRTASKNGKHRLWIELSPDALNHVAHYTRHVLTADSVESDGDDPDGADDASSKHEPDDEDVVDDTPGSASQGHADPCTPICEVVNERAVSSELEPTPPPAVSADEPIAKRYRIFESLAKGAGPNITQS